jgi:hypothetical protein
LAQYVFASFGTAISVPHHEDSGIDLYCTLMERIGRVSWPRAYFSVQVKSTTGSWLLDGKDSVRWLVEHPLPFFLCVVDKSAARLRLYHTSPRFYVWAVLGLPDRLELVPGTGSEGECTQWQGDTTFSLSAPILDVSISELFDDEMHRRASDVLRYWIDVDLENLARIRNGIRTFAMPGGYKTNATGFSSRVTQGINNDPDLTQALARMKECVAYVCLQLQRKGDLAGGLRCAMLLRHFFPEERDGVTHNVFLHNAINDLLGVDGNYLYRGVESLNAWLDEKIRPSSCKKAC